MVGPNNGPEVHFAGRVPPLRNGPYAANWGKEAVLRNSFPIKYVSFNEFHSFPAPHMKIDFDPNSFPSNIQYYTQTNPIIEHTHAAHSALHYAELGKKEAKRRLASTSYLPRWQQEENGK